MTTARRDAGLVLLVDDEPKILSSLRRVLRREGYRIESVENARDALARVADGGVDVVVSDHKMPGMKGIELLARLGREHPSTARILLSGWSSEIPADQLAAARLDAVLSKPWDEALLKESIRKALTGRGARLS